jgi:putative colanic acid biosynthesis UDP-glucose lipid carrier transferase
MIAHYKHLSFYLYQKEEERTLSSYVREKKRYLIIKRTVDIIISAAVTVFILTWLFPVMALLIKLTSRGPVLFVQKRVGRYGKSFYCLKFRTMIVNDAADLRQAQENDIRVTRVGKFLRHANLDEFPQFLNVLMGQMSIVGPRPHMHSDNHYFSSLIPYYKFRNMVKPGITGLAQIKGYRGPTNDFPSIFHRYQFDAFYIRNLSLALDFRIIRTTAKQTLGTLVKHAKDLFSLRRWMNNDIKRSEVITLN